jgi:hemolysin activation/secretion protein
MRMALPGPFDLRWRAAKIKKASDLKRSGKGAIPAGRRVRQLAGTAGLVLSAAVCAQQPPAPGAGDALRDLGEKAREIPQPRGAPTIEVAPPAPRAVKPAPGFKLDIKGFRFSGLTEIPPDALLPLVSKYAGPDRTFEDLEAAARAVTDYLREHGWFVAQAYIPEQKLEHGIVEIAVLEGRLAQIRVEVPPGSPVSRRMIESTLSVLKPGTVMRAETIERALFIANDLRGVAVRSVVEPGPAPGTANLVVQVVPVKRVDGTLEFDNFGSRFTGENRFGASVNVNSPLGFGDLLSFRGLLGVPGGGEDTDFARLAYLAPVGPYGTKLGAAYLKLRYRLGTDAFRALDQRGDSDVTSVFALHPVLRARSYNLFAQANFDVRDFHDERRALGTVSDRTIDAGTLSLNGDLRDTLLGGGFNTASLALTRGDLELKTSADLATDRSAAGRHADGSYTKLNGALSRQQALFGAFSLYGSYAFQLASKNLDGSEKISLGGPSAVRAYAQGEATSDEAQLATVEARYTLPAFAFVPGNVQASVFYDWARGRLNESPLPSEAASNHRTLAGAGFGLTWGQQDNFYVRGTLAWRTTGAPISDTADRIPRFYFQLVKFL